MNAFEEGSDYSQNLDLWHKVVDLLPSPDEPMQRITFDQIKKMASSQIGVEVSEDGQNLCITTKKDNQGRPTLQVWLDETGLVVKRTSVIWTFEDPSTGNARKTWENNFAYDDQRRLIEDKCVYIREDGNREVSEVTTWTHGAGEGNYTEERKRGETVDITVFRNFKEDVSQRKTETISS